MRTFLILSILLQLGIAGAQDIGSGGTSPRATDSKDFERDFAMVCEVAKMAGAMKKSKLFSPADLAARLSAMLEAGLVTSEVKQAKAAISMAESKARVGLWKQAAKDSGLKSWKCDSLANL